jgi:hypothetical protein
MELLYLLPLALIALSVVTRREQARRIALLGAVLGPYRIEPLMENLTEGYLRWLGEPDAGRRAQIWGNLQSAEQALAEQFGRFAADFARQVPAPQAQVSKLPIALPWAQPLLPGSRLFDARRLFELHARGIAAAAQNAQQQADKARAFMMTAELYLMQHSCHWFCRSRAVAGARLLARHRTHHQQVLAAVSPQTRRDYLALVG